MTRLLDLYGVSVLLVGSVTIARLTVLGIAELILTVTDVVFLFLADDAEDALEGGTPHVEAGSDLAPLVLAKDAVGGTVDEEGLFLLGELALDEADADGVDGPHLDVVRGDLQGLGDGSVGEGAGLRGGSGDAGEGEQTHLALQGSGVEVGLGQEIGVGLVEVAEVVELLGVEDFEQLEPDGLGLAQGLDRVELGQVVEVKVGGRNQGLL